MPIPHCHVEVPKTADVMLPDTQVLMRKGKAGIKEKKTRDRSEVMSATTTSINKTTQVYPIWYKTEPPANDCTLLDVASTMVPMT